jgi:hypothetical protein
MLGVLIVGVLVGLCLFPLLCQVAVRLFVDLVRLGLFLSWAVLVPRLHVL